MTDGAGLDVPQIARDGRLAGKTAIVTGGGSSGEMAGTGAAMSILFAVKGANVVVLDQDESRARHTQREIESRGGTSIVVVADITSSAECDRSVAETVAAYGRVDILVNNAAIAPGEQENSLELWDRIIDLNLRAAKLMMNAVIPLMRSQGGGSIVNIGSVAALRAGGGQAYSAAKAGLVGSRQGGRVRRGTARDPGEQRRPRPRCHPDGPGFSGLERGPGRRSHYPAQACTRDHARDRGHRLGRGRRGAVPRQR